MGRRIDEAGGVGPAGDGEDGREGGAVEVGVRGRAGVVGEHAHDERVRAGGDEGADGPAEVVGVIGDGFAHWQGRNVRRVAKKNGGRMEAETGLRENRKEIGGEETPIRRVATRSGKWRRG